jgi:hypothetical protein
MLATFDLYKDKKISLWKSISSDDYIDITIQSNGETIIS